MRRAFCLDVGAPAPERVYASQPGSLMLASMADVGRLESRLSAYRRRFGTGATIALVAAFGAIASLAVCSLR